MECPGLSALWASGAASMYLWSRSEKELEVLRRLPAARGRIAAGLQGSCKTRYAAAAVPTSTAP
jgi:hypothetical protein